MGNSQRAARTAPDVSLADVLAMLQQARAEQAARDADMLAELHAIRDLLERRRREPDETSVRLLASIHSAVQDRVFVSKELVVHAGLPQAEELRAAIIAAVGSLNARRLGKLLKRIEGRTLGQCCVGRISQDRTGAIWQVRAGLREWTPANPPPKPRRAECDR